MINLRTRNFRRKIAQNYQRPVQIVEQGLLGDTSGVVKIRDHWVWITLINGDLVKAWNEKVPNSRPGLHVELEWQRGRWYVTRALDDFDDPVFTGVVEHADTHARFGGDIDWVDETRILPGLVTAYSGMTVAVYALAMLGSSAWKVTSTQYLDLTSYIPASGANWLLLEMTTAGTITATAGASVSARELLTESGIPMPVTSGKALAAVKMYYGQSAVVQSSTQNDIRDLRWGKDGTGRYDHLTLDTLAFNTTYAPTGSEPAGTAHWNSEDETVDVVLPDDVHGQMFLEDFFDFENRTGATITNGTPLMFAGTIGSSGRIKAQKAIADGSLPSEYIIGIATHDVLDGEMGKATWRGKVRKLNTTGAPYGETWADGNLIYVSPDTSGNLTKVKPDAPDRTILVAAVIHAHATNGILLVRPTWNPKLTDLDDVDGGTPSNDDIIQRKAGVWTPRTMAQLATDLGGAGVFVPYSVLNDTQDPTGWVDPSAVTVTYDSATRKITLTGTLEYYWCGVKHTLTSPWVSDAHANVEGTRYFLYSTDGTNFAWSTTPWDFYYLMVALVRYETSYKFGLREPHGLMPWQVHRELHETLSAYRVSGGGLVAGTYVENTATDAATTPGFAELTMADEDIESIISAWPEGTYTTMRIGASSAPTFDTAASFPFRSSGSFILVNNPTTGAETAAATNQYVNIYILRLPCSSDAGSQVYRLVCLQPQRAYTSLAAAQAEDTRSLSLGDLTPSVPEIVFYERITYVLSAGDANTGKCRIATGGISYIFGTRMSQISAGGAGGVQTAENTPYTPTGNISATNVQLAIDELDTEKQPLDTDLTAIAALSPANDDVIQRKSGAWTNRTMAQLAADLMTLAPLASPALTGNPTAPTPAVSDNDTSIATTAFVMAQRGDIPSGATLPASPLANQLFMHTPTGRRVLMVYTGSAWYPVFSFGAITTYVDGSLGTDSENNGYGSGANAYKTLSYAWTQIPGNYFGNIVVNVAAGTYAERLNAYGKRAGGAFTITINGTWSTVTSGTITGGVQGSGATLGTATISGAGWTVDAYKGKFAAIGSQIYPIKSNDGDTVTICGYWSGAPSGTLTIQEPGTIIDGGGSRPFGIYLDYMQTLFVNYCKIQNSTSYEVYASTNSYIRMFYCVLAPASNKAPLRGYQSRLWINSSVVIANGSSITQSNNNSYALFQNTFLYQSSGTKSGIGMYVNDASSAAVESCHFDNFSSALYVYGNGICSMGSTYNFVTNNTNGLVATQGGQIVGTTTNQYSGNTTNESATAASYGYID